MNKIQQLIEYAIQDVIAYIVDDTGIEFDYAMSQFFQSEVFDKLQDESTGLYLEGSGYIYDLYKNERINGKLVQVEV